MPVLASPLVNSSAGIRCRPTEPVRLMGGSSSINGLVFLRGHRSAIDAWEAAGAKGWGYDDLLPYYRRSEHTEGLDPRYRGTGGRCGPSPQP